MIEIRPVIKGIENLAKSLSAENQRQHKALNAAIRIEGFRLMSEMKKGIRAGSPGGSAFPPLSFIQQRLGRNKKPLSKLAIAVRYNIVVKDPIEFAVGFTGPQISKSWKRIATRNQDGFSFAVGEKRRKFFAEVGASLKKNQHRAVFFLRADTTRFKIPSRPIIVPFWERHKSEAVQNISKNYQTKLVGGRI